MRHHLRFRAFQPVGGPGPAVGQFSRGEVAHGISIQQREYSVHDGNRRGRVNVRPSTARPSVTYSLTNVVTLVAGSEAVKVPSLSVTAVFAARSSLADVTWGV